jgi:hypothetical protein
MKRFCAGLAGIAALAGSAWLTPALAVPPTTTPSPGYDARLQESRSRNSAVTPQLLPAPHRRPVRRPHHR